MLKFRRSLPVCLVAAAIFSAQSAFAAPVYTQLINTGTSITTDFTTSTQTTAALISPYGTGGVSAFNGGWLITFSPISSQFNASTHNSTDSLRVETDGKITFTLTFPSAINLTAIINEGGSYNMSGAGTASILAGGIVVEMNDPLPNRESIGSTSSVATFNTDNTWSSTISLGSFNGLYSSYKFSIDNYLKAEDLAPGSATITKDYFTIFIPPPGGQPNAAPLPLAGVGGSALAGLLLLFRKKLARSVA